jgi:uncharacterized protein YeaO (DUF488 family)
MGGDDMADPEHRIAIKRAYEPRAHGDGVRVLVDRLWPRGLRKDAAEVDKWPKELAPSTELRRSYGHRPDRFRDFRKRYAAELRNDEAAAAVAQLLRLNRRRALTLLTASRDLERSDAAVLAAHLRTLAGRQPNPRPAR